MNKLNKYEQIILAGAIGDAFGYLVEFDKWETIKSKYGQNGITFDKISKNDWCISDDTQMTLFCLDVINKNIKENNDDLKKINKEIYLAFLDWNRTQFAPVTLPKSDLGLHEELWSREAPGNTCLSALGSGRMGAMERKINNSKGCGGIMRVAPITFLELPLEETFKLGCMQAAITHSHPDGYLSSGFFAGLLQELIKGTNFIAAVEKNIEILKIYEDHDEILIYINKVMSHISMDEVLEHQELNNMLGEGWVGEEALGIAMYAMQKGTSFEQVLDIATNHNGDSDSTASLAGQLYIAQNNLPHNFENSSELFTTSKVFSYLFSELELSLQEKENNKLEKKVETSENIKESQSVIFFLRRYFKNKLARFNLFILFLI